ncbi:MAG: hypothetical protein J0I20_25915 [Chloroflexi bacterium]|nr:hypothetical protein [Chloroflexota bacterium]OJW06505.1 MAG: hypothetical protein BGO39_00385 [Chloroflexi bacterium 54-19]
MDASQFIGEMRVWTDRDFDFMGWHDATVHGLVFRPQNYSFALDLDYILKWVEPEPPESFYSFWVAPATLAFENVSELEIAIQSNLPQLTLFGIERDDERPVPNGHLKSWRYILDADQGTITFRATGFTQKFRNLPVFTRQQSLTEQERGDFNAY